MPTLRDVQTAFARGLLTRDPSLAAPYVLDDAAIPPVERLGIYRNTFVGTLIQALRNTYPAVERLVGAEFFEGAATLFVGKHPPLSAYLNDYGAAFGDFLADFAPAASLPYLPDVARLEWVLSCVANAADAPALDPGALGGLSEAEQGLIRFEPHPAVRLIRLTHDADVIRQAVVSKEEDSFKGFTPDPKPFWLIAHRAGLEVVMRRLADADAAISEALFGGRPLAKILTPQGMETQIAVLADHLANGRFTSFEVTPEAPNA
jgi:hypothetical protein